MLRKIKAESYIDSDGVLRGFIAPITEKEEELLMVA